MVMQHSLTDPRQYAVLVLTGFLSALPRYRTSHVKQRQVTLDTVWKGHVRQGLVPLGRDCGHDIR